MDTDNLQSIRLVCEKQALLCCGKHLDLPGACYCCCWCLLVLVGGAVTAVFRTFVQLCQCSAHKLLLLLSQV
jgi:hypothetical protein